MRPVSHYIIITILITLLSISCSSVRQIRPLEKNQSSLTMSVGGPITQVGKIYIPLPLLSLGYNYGLLDKKLDMEVGWGITQAMCGIMDIDLGVNWRPFLNDRFRPGLMVSPKSFIMTNFKPKSFRFYPDLSLTAFWEIKRFWYVYTGLENFFELSRTRADGNKQPNHWLIAPFCGIDIGNERWQFQIEIRLYTPNLSNQGKPTKNIGIGDYGVWGGFLGVNRTFGGKKR